MKNSSNKQDPKRGFFSSIRHEFQELQESFLDDNQKKRLEKMNWFGRLMHLTAWLLKLLFLKLTRVRRILLIIGIVFIFAGRNNGNDDGAILGLVIFLFILMLELKDKLLAKDELQAGRAVQNALLPERSPTIPGWDIWLFTHPANDVGGDLVDYIKLNEDEFALAIGDVAGKGLPAALFMAKLQATLRVLAPDFKSLPKLGNKINEIFFREGLPDKFVSLIYMVLRSNRQTVNLLNAGHMPPIIAKDNAIEELQKGDPALGLMRNVPYSEQKIELKNGDMMLIYSDGLTEAQDNNGNFFGSQRLINFIAEHKNLTAKQIGERLLTEVDQFIGEAKVHDDLSLIILKRNE